MPDYKEILTKYIPNTSTDIIYDWIVESNIMLKITRSRKTKLGDYRPPQHGKGHQISVNHDLNEFSFLITLVHEIAHLKVWEVHKNNVKPHGKEWKCEFKDLMSPFIDKDIFPEELKSALIKYLSNAFASSGSDLELARILSNDDTLLEEIPENTIFTIDEGINRRIFMKQEKLRKRYRCVCLNNKRVYLFNPLAKVIVLKK